MSCFNYFIFFVLFIRGKYTSLIFRLIYLCRLFVINCAWLSMRVRTVHDHLVIFLADEFNALTGRGFSL